MKRLAFILTAAVLWLLPAAPAVAQDSIAFEKGPGLVLQSPLPASLTGLAIATGASPMFCEPMMRQNLLIREEVQMWRRGSMDFRPLTFDNVIQFVPLVSTVALNLCGVPSRHSDWPLMRRALGSAVISTTLVHSVKFFVDEMRPDFSSRNSFPSGHTSFAFSGAELLRLEYGHTSPWIPVAGYAVALLTGFMRVYNDRHWTGDVLAGAGFGIIAADLSYWLNDYIERKVWKK